MEKCDYCGEYKKVRKKYNPTGKHIGGYIIFDYICEKCDVVITDIEKKEIEQYNKEEEKRQKKWIKLRDNYIVSESEVSE